MVLVNALARANGDRPVAGRQMSLQRRIDMLLRHGQKHDLVVRQQVLFDRAGERQAVELRPVDLRVVHGEHVDVMAWGRASRSASDIAAGSVVTGISSS